MTVFAAAFAGEHTNGDAAFEPGLKPKVFKPGFSVENAAAAEVAAIKGLDNTGPQTGAVPAGVAGTTVLVGFAVFWLELF